MRHSQIVGKNALKGWQGLLVILAVLVSIYALNALFTFFTVLGLDYLIGSILFWVSGVGIAVFLFYRFAIVYQYDMGEVKLVLSRVYIKNPRVMEEILTREIVFLGSLEDARKRYPNAGVRRALTRRAGDSACALVYVRGKVPHIILWSPNAELRGAVESLFRK